ncbi:hypothetical protein [Jannaschia donghaensis]|nr:hypothetical protein [Jannaschia donghaensis]
MSSVWPSLAHSQEAPTACLTPAADTDTTLAALATQGWTALPDSTLPQDVADRLVWLYVAHYTTGDTGGEALASIVDLQSRTIKGLARKRDIPTSKTRFLTRHEGAMILFWRAPVPGRFELQCRIALDGPDTPGSDPFARHAMEQVDHGQILTVALDRAALARATGRDVKTAQLVDTYLIYGAEDAR